jgi:hypothetical protein
MVHDSDDWDVKRAMLKVPVVYLNTPLEYPQWTLALRRLVGSCNMVESLLYTMPKNQEASYKKKYEANVASLKSEVAKAEKGESIPAFFSFAEEGEEVKGSPPEAVDLTAEIPIVREPIGRVISC